MSYLRMSLLTLSLCMIGAPAYAYLPWNGGWSCPQPAYISGHRPQGPRCAGGTVTSLQTGAAADTAESAWLSWWVLNTSNYALWIDRSSCNTISPVLNNSDGSSVVRLDTYGGNASTT